MKIFSRMARFPVRLAPFGGAALICAVLLGAALPGCTPSAAGGPGVDESGRNGDFGIPDGHCNRRAVGAVLGGAIGGLIGSQIGEGRIAMLVGAAVGTLIGSEIGRQMDETDLACAGEGLEKAVDNQPVVWPSADRKTTYRLTPLSSYVQDGRDCRAFLLQAATQDGVRDGNGRACRGDDARWRVVE